MTTAGHAALLFAITPIFVYHMAIPHLGETWSYGKGIGIMLAVVGSAVIILETGFELDYRTLAKLKGTYTDALAKLVNPETGRIHTAYALASGTILYFPFGLYRLIDADMSRVDTYGWLSILYIAIVTSVIGYSIWYWLLKYMEASKASVLVNIQPIVAGILGYYLLGETISLPFVVGGIIILTGVTVTQQAGRLTKKRPQRIPGPL